MRVDFISGPINGAYQLLTDDTGIYENLSRICKSLSTPERKFWHGEYTIRCGNPTMTAKELESLPYYELVNNLFIWVEPANVKHS